MVQFVASTRLEGEVANAVREKSLSLIPPLAKRESRLSRSFAHLGRNLVGANRHKDELLMDKG